MRHTLLTAVLLLSSGIGAFQASGANIVANPGFETGDLTGWALSGTNSSPADNGIYYGVDAGDAHSGAYGAYFGPVGGVLNLSQAIGTTPGAVYIVSFWLAQAPDTPASYVNSFAVSFGGVTLYSQKGVPAGGFLPYTFAGAAPGASSSLQFSFRDDTGFFSLDDVSVDPIIPPATPEPATALLVLPVAALWGWYKWYTVNPLRRN